MENYEEWNVTIPSIPPRSRFYHLKPINIGMPYVESLTSYIVRLAEAHCLSPKDLVIREILLTQDHVDMSQEQYYRLTSSWNKHAHTLNGIGPLAKQWIATLQSLTLNDNLRFLTMLPWSDVIDHSGLVRQIKAWCPSCYEEWRNNCHDIYDPLLWSINGIEICLRHQRLLATLCPHCRKTQPFLTRSTRSGYCSYCMFWLGNTVELHSSEAISLGEKDNKWRIWITEAVGDLLAATSTLSSIPSKEQVAAMTRICLDEYAGGNMSAFSRFLGVSVQQPWQYLRGRIPHLDSLLHMCYNLSITPLEFLTTDSIRPRTTQQLAVTYPLPLSRNKKKPLREDDVDRMRQMLEKVLLEEKEQFSTLQEIAQRMDFHVATLREYCPHLCRAIVDRYRRRWIDDEVSTQMRQELERALVSDECPSLAKISLVCGRSSPVLRRHFPDLCKAVVKRHRERFDYILIQQQLEEVLTGDGEVLSVQELARRMGYKRDFLRRKFPLLCGKISELYHLQRNNRHEKKIDDICAEIRSAMLTLHQQNVYPSIRKVTLAMGNPYILFSSVTYETWRETLRGLGYSTEDEIRHTV